MALGVPRSLAHLAHISLCTPSESMTMYVVEKRNRKGMSTGVLPVQAYASDAAAAAHVARQRATSLGRVRAVLGSATSCGPGPPR